MKPRKLEGLAVQWKQRKNFSDGIAIQWHSKGWKKTYVFWWQRGIESWVQFWIYWGILRHSGETVKQTAGNRGLEGSAKVCVDNRNVWVIIGMVPGPFWNLMCVFSRMRMDEKRPEEHRPQPCCVWPFYPDNQIGIGISHRHLPCKQCVEKCDHSRGRLLQCS